MNSLSIKQILKLVADNKVLSSIFIFGVALAITMVMVLQIVYQIKFGNLNNEPYRDRTLYMKSLTATQIINGKAEQSWTSGLSAKFIKECCFGIQDVELVSASSLDTKKSVVSSNDVKIQANYLLTDDVFFNLHNFIFISGSPFSRTDFESGIAKAVISENTALKLFNSVDDVIGRSIMINFKEFRVCGVVQNVSTLSSFVYSDIWIPYSYSNFVYEDQVGNSGHTSGALICYFLAKSSSDYNRIKAQVESNIKRYNAGLANGWQISSTEQPYNLFMANRKESKDIDYTSEIWRYIMSISLFLIIPAINLSGLTIARMKKRYAELGIRKAFGATKWTILKQMIGENMILTLIGGVLGVIISYFAIELMSGFIFGDISYRDSLNPSARNVDLSMFFQLSTFVYAILYCVIINLLSSIIPAFIAARKEIIALING